MAYLLPLSLALLLMCHGSLAQSGEQEKSQEGSRFWWQSKCRIDRIKPQEPARRVESEAGAVEYFDESNEQFGCAGVRAHRRIIKPRGLLTPSFYNAHAMTYVIQGRGVFGTVTPGCPASFQSFQQREPRKQQGQGQNPRDQHQGVNVFREGDVIVQRAGEALWAFNDGDQDVVTFTVVDTSSNANQLDSNPREFLLAGRKQSGQGSSHGEEDYINSILSGFDTETMSQVMGIKKELAEKIMGRTDKRGDTVRVEGGLHIVSPSSRQEQEERESEEERERQEKEKEKSANGLEQAFCSMRMRHNIDDPSRADIYNPNAGRTTTLNSQKLTILRYIQLNAVRGVLQKNAFVAPHWNINAHSVMYATAGSAIVQIVGNRGNTVFSGVLRRGQVIVVPQNFALLIQAKSEGFEWVAIKTNDNAMISPIVGKTSVYSGLPVDVLRIAYQVSRDEATQLKNNRGEEMVVFEPSPPESKGRADA